MTTGKTIAFTRRTFVGKFLLAASKHQAFYHILLELQLIGKDPDAEKDWRQEEKKPAEDEMVG